MDAGFANTPEPPYYAVIFTSRRTDGDNGYDAMATAMFELAPVLGPKAFGTVMMMGLE